jgi:POT family proton-dependent oligopeptide transporter
MSIPIPGATRTQRFSVVLLIELWERFGYYGMQALLLLFLVERLGFADRDANLLWGAFAALTYAAPAIGGWLGDQVLGSRRSMVSGACVLCLGYLLLAIPTDDRTMLFLAMGTIAIGNGLFKPNAANMVRRIYEGDDSRLDAAFTLYYMAVNVGSTASILLSPLLKDRFGWHAAFAMNSAGLAFGVAVYAALHGRLATTGSEPDGRPLPSSNGWSILAGVLVAILLVMLILQHPLVARVVVWGAGLAILAIWARIYMRALPSERPGLLTAYLLTLEVMLYFVFYQQQPTSLTLFALRNVSPAFRIGEITLFSMSPGQFQALNPLWIMVLSPPLAWLYGVLGRRGSDVQVSVKYLIGFGFVTAGFLVWWLATGPGAPAHVSPWIMVAGYGLVSFGELLVSALGLAMLARYTPVRLSAFMMGAFYVAVGVALYTGSAIANLAALPPGLATVPAEQSLPLYHGLFLNLLLGGGGVTVVVAALLPTLRRLDRAHQAAITV